MITYKELNIKAKELEKKTGLQNLDIYRRFMFERILFIKIKGKIY